MKLTQNLNFPMIASAPFFVLPFNNIYFSRVLRFLSRKNVSIGIVLLLFVAAISIMWIITSFVIHIAYLYTKPLLPARDFTWNILEWKTSLLLFCWSMWICSVYFIGSYLAQLSQFFTPRLYLFISAFLPSLFFGFIKSRGSILFIANSHSNYIFYCFSAIALILLWTYLFLSHDDNALASGYLALGDQARTWRSSIRLRGIFISFTGTITLYLIKGIFLFHIIAFMVALPQFVIFMVVLFALVKWMMLK
jgi:hypothetical protein